MIDITLLISSITILFILFIGMNSLVSLKVCALCGAVFVSWLMLLVLFYTGYNVDSLLIGILMGGSVVGVMYMLENKLSEHFRIFKLPFFLTLFSLAYFVLRAYMPIYAVILLGAIWLITAVVYALRNTENLKDISKKIIQCCKNW